MKKIRENTLGNAETFQDKTPAVHRREILDEKKNKTENEGSSA